MQSKLFAFQVSKPMEAVSYEAFEGSYDPQTQVQIWHGNARPSAVYCTYLSSPYGHSGCNAYGSYCTTYGGTGHYSCD